MEENLSSELTVSVLAGVAALSPFHFSRAFAAATGVSPYAYLTARRIASARRSLALDRMSVEEAMAASGFRTVAQFTRMFGRATGVTPARFRREVLEVEAPERRLLKNRTAF